MSMCSSADSRVDEVPTWCAPAVFGSGLLKTGFLQHFDARIVAHLDEPTQSCAWSIGEMPLDKHRSDLSSETLTPERASNEVADAPGVAGNLKKVSQGLAQRDPQSASDLLNCNCHISP